MKQIYDFETENPPILNERMIKNKIEKRRLQRQTALVALAGILMGIAMIMLGCFVYAEYPVLAVVCFAYVIIAATGSGVMAVVCSRKEGLLLWRI